MTKFRWRTTILLIGIIAAFLSLASYWNVSPVMATVFLLLSLLLLIGVSIFGKRGV